MKIEHIHSASKGHFDVRHNGNEGMVIEEHQPLGEGDKWFYDVIQGNRVCRLFDVDQVNFIKED